jgi:RNA polymerase sigma-70 factor (ECF subfamily)
MTYGRVSDEMLMQQAAEGDRDGFSQLVRRHANALLNFIDRMVGNRHRSEELFQEVVLAVWTKRDQYTNSQPVKPWLYKIALNRCRQEFRGVSRFTLPLVDGPPIESRGESPFKHVVNQETTEAVQAAVARLPEAQRAVVTLRIWNGMSYAEIGEAMGRTEGTVRSYMHHALQTLRKYLEREVDR